MNRTESHNWECGIQDSSSSTAQSGKGFLMHLSSFLIGDKFNRTLYIYMQFLCSNILRTYHHSCSCFSKFRNANESHHLPIGSCSLGQQIPFICSNAKYNNSLNDDKCNENLTLDQAGLIFILIANKVYMRARLNKKWISICKRITPCGNKQERW